MFAPIQQRCLVSKKSVSARMSKFSVRCSAVNADQVRKARSAIRSIIQETHANPIFVRLAWHDSGSYDASLSGEPWPAAGGATASIRYKPEIGYGANNGLQSALDLLEPVKAACPDVSWADIIQLASAEAISCAGGPHIPLRVGRKDATGPQDCTPDGRLPAAAGPFPDKAENPAGHLRNVFYRMGLNDQDIVVLSGAHTLGRARPERSGFGKESTKYTKNGPGLPGGSSWTVQWLDFDNKYFVEVKEQRDQDLLVLPTDACLFEDEGFRPFAEKYASDNDAFCADYVASHLKLSELGSGWVEGAPVEVKMDPLEQFCDEDPSADECRVYED